MFRLELTMLKRAKYDALRIEHSSESYLGIIGSVTVLS